MDMFMGWIPGSIGETSTLMCLIGATILVITGLASWRIMVSMVIGGLAMGWLVETAGANFFGAENFFFHIVAGGFAFGTVFMATDPVSATHTNTGKLWYGFLSGAIAILIRVINPAYPEGIMLAILLMNVFAPLIDYFVVSANKTRRVKRATV
jgi:Na+-transporting NADH:ubiquinone oxidoreductase subunit B